MRRTSIVNRRKGRKILFWKGTSPFFFFFYQNMIASLKFLYNSTKEKIKIDLVKITAITHSNILFITFKKIPLNAHPELL